MTILMNGNNCNKSNSYERPNKAEKVGAFKKLAKRLFYEDDYVMIAG
ncbi:hypothetical protein H3S75_00350 [Gilliamella sp. B14384G15]|nr:MULTISPECIES: hypothetical protein [unclassified Gilliamella]MBI0029685.1 hypothetical protein [Gilliamella sp. B14384G15]MBI0057464.1 hypothetical protein [Gilliamella sp. B14384G12]